MARDRKKREWFDLGAAAFARVCPGMFEQATYPCPICLTCASQKVHLASDH